MAACPNSEDLLGAAGLSQPRTTGSAPIKACKSVGLPVGEKVEDSEARLSTH